MSNRLAELMREGIHKTECLRNGWIKRTEKHCYACAMGAALLACNPDANDGLSNRDLVATLQECSGIDMGQWVTHPETSERYRLWEMIISLNDHYKWPRLKIAKWVDSLDLT